jgi:hypothetical protein
MHICLIWTLLVRSILGRFLLPYWDVSFVHLNTQPAVRQFVNWVEQGIGTTSRVSYAQGQGGGVKQDINR